MVTIGSQVSQHDPAAGKAVLVIARHRSCEWGGGGNVLDMQVLGHCDAAAGMAVGIPRGGPGGGSHLSGLCTFRPGRES